MTSRDNQGVHHSSTETGRDSRFSVAINRGTSSTRHALRYHVCRVSVSLSFDLETNGLYNDVCESSLSKSSVPVTESKYASVLRQKQADQWQSQTTDLTLSAK